MKLNYIQEVNLANQLRIIGEPESEVSISAAS